MGGERLHPIIRRTVGTLCADCCPSEPPSRRVRCVVEEPRVPAEDVELNHVRAVNRRVSDPERRVFKQRVDRELRRRYEGEYRTGLAPEVGAMSARKQEMRVAVA